MEPSRAQSSRWILASTVITRPIQLSMHVLLARMLQPAGFGLLSLANSTAVSLSGIAWFGLDAAINRFTAEYYRRDAPVGRTFASLIVSISILISTTFFLAMAWIAPVWGFRIFPPATPPAMVGLCLLLGWMNVLTTGGFNLLTGLQLFNATALFSILQSVLMMAGALLFGYLWGPTGAMAGYLAASAGCIGYTVWKLWTFDRRLFQWHASFQNRRLKEILGFSIPAWLGSLAFGPVTTLALALLAHQPGGSYQVGLYQTANALKMILGVLPGITGPIISTAIMEEGGRLGRPEAYGKLLQDSILALGFLTLPVLTFLLFCRSSIFLVYGPRYEGASEIFVPLIMSVGVSIIASPAQFAFIAKSRIWRLQGIGVLKAAALLLCAGTWAPRFLAYGLGWSFLVAELAFALCLQEFGIRWKVLAPETRVPFYSFFGAIAAILAAGLWLPAVAAQALALPASVGLAIFLIRRYPAVAGWIVQVSPASLRPGIRRSLNTFCPEPVA